MGCTLPFLYFFLSLFFSFWMQRRFHNVREIWWNQISKMLKALRKIRDPSNNTTTSDKEANWVKLCTTKLFLRYIWEIFTIKVPLTLIKVSLIKIVIQNTLFSIKVIHNLNSASEWSTKIAEWHMSKTNYFLMDLKWLG